MDSLIRWKRQDSERLTRAINRFNREVSAIKDADVKLPKKVKYDFIRDHIASRQELDEIIDSLNSANQRTLTETQELESGERVSIWRYNEALRRRDYALENLEEEKRRIYEGKFGTGNLYMGEERLEEIQNTINRLQGVFKSKEKFEANQRTLLYQGRSDLTLAKNKLFMDNFYTALGDISNYKNAGLLKKKLRQIRNPNKFYDYVKKSNILMDIFLWYKEDDGSLIYSNFDSNEQAFNSALANDLNLNIEVD